MRVLSEAEVRDLLPGPQETVDLVEDALVALAEGRADVPPKPAVRTTPGMSAHAMPAAYPERGLLGCKWITVVPDNALRGLPAASGVMVVSDGVTGRPTCVLPAGELTAARTAAVSGACVRALAPPGPVAFLGAGVQARSHLAVLAALGHREVRVWARRGSAVRALAEESAARRLAVRVLACPSREAAVRDAAVVVTALRPGLTDTRLDPSWVAEDALLLPLDWASSVGPEVAEGASVLAADDVRQFVAVREERRAMGAYPTPTAWTGHLLRAPRPPGRVVVQNTGSGLCDLVVAAVVAERAEARGTGTVLQD
ncbi:MAG TPA: NAD(P)-binding domain-containing protein [Dermatophilaceae bacterium]|nr:NAD(P)-binding domain-containing protein [Dermatophilaceae bacterium]